MTEADCSVISGISFVSAICSIISFVMTNAVSEVFSRDIASILPKWSKSTSNGREFGTATGLVIVSSGIPVV